MRLLLAALLALVLFPRLALSAPDGQANSALEVTEAQARAGEELCDGRLIKVWITEKTTTKSLPDGIHEVMKVTIYEACIDPAVKQSVLHSMEAARTLIESGHRITVQGTEMITSASRGAARRMIRAIVPTAAAASAKRAPKH